MLITDRRTFLQSIGALSVLSSPTVPIQYAGTERSIDVFRITAGRRKKLQSVASQRPSGITLDRFGRFLFAANEIREHQGLPAGSVESYAVQPDGRLQLICCTSLSLSATLPKRVAISPDGRWMVVAAFGGGLYNVMPVSKMGEVGPASQIIKEIGRGPDPDRQACAHPHSVAFHPSGNYVISTDVGSDRIKVFAFETGRMRRIQEVRLYPGSQPGELVMNDTGAFFSVTHQLDGAISRYRFDRGCMVSYD